MGWAFVRGWHVGKNYPSDFNRPFGPLVHDRLIEHYVRTSDELSVLGVLESVFDLAVCIVAEEKAFPISRFEFSTVDFRYEGVCLASENPHFVVIRQSIIPEVFEVLELYSATYGLCVLS